MRSLALRDRRKAVPRGHSDTHFSHVVPRVESPSFAELAPEAEHDAVRLLTDLFLEAVSKRATSEPSTASASMEESEER